MFEEVTIESKLTQGQTIQIKELLRKHKDIFAKDDSDIGRCNVIKHRIDLLDNTPFKQAHKRIPPNMIDEVRQHLEQLLSSGVITKSKSPRSSNVVKEWKTTYVCRLQDVEQ